MAHCGPEETAVALAQITEADTWEAWDNAVVVRMMAEMDLMFCEEEHGP